MTNQESIECTCRVGTVVTDGRVDGDEVIIHGPCHSPGPEVWEALEAARHALQLTKERVEQGDFLLSDRLVDGLAGRQTLGEVNAALAKARKLLSTRKEKV